MMNVSSTAMQNAIAKVVGNLRGITSLYPNQLSLLDALFSFDSIFYTSATNSGKTLPPLMYPYILKELSGLDCDVPADPKILFVTALNSLQLSLLSNAKALGIQCDAISSSNIKKLLTSKIPILFVSPEVLKQSVVTSALLQYRASFVLKVIDEAHLGKNAFKIYFK